METLMKTHFPSCRETEDGVAPSDIEVPFNVEEGQAGFLSPDLLAWSISSFRPFKAPGPDGIQAKVLQELGPGLSLRFLHLTPRGSHNRLTIFCGPNQGHFSPHETTLAAGVRQCWQPL